MIVVDVETSGLDPQKHSIVSIGAVDFALPTCLFYQECRIFEGAMISEEALSVNGFTVEQITDPSKPSLEETIRAFYAWTDSCVDRTIAGENPTFDRNFLHAAAQRYGLRLIFGHRSIDLHTLAYTHHQRRGLTLPLRDARTDLNLDKILVYVGLPEEPKPHHALTGAKMEAEAFHRFIYGESLFPEFKQYHLPGYLLYGTKASKM